MSDNLTGTKVKDTYVKIVQVVGGKLYDGLGNIINPLGLGLTYEHVQSSPSLDWTFTHMLGRYPNVSITDSAGSLLYADVHYDDHNTITINFSQLTSGKAWCS